MANSTLSPKEQKDLFCQEQAKLKPWNQPGYDAHGDECGQYGYVPSIYLGIGFTAAFGILTLLHTGFVFYSRRWSLFTITVGGIIEIVGWVSRVLSNNNPYSDGPFIAQTTTLIIGPTLFSAALYLLFGVIIVQLGEHYSLLKPKLYGLIFIGADFISLVLQGAGGGIAATADDSDTSKMGTNIMEGGIVFQLVATIVFGFLALSFRRKAKKDDGLPARRTPLWYLEVALAVGTGAIIVRGIYRTVELAQGWDGYLATHEIYILFDAVPMVILLLALALAHPFWTLPLPGREPRKIRKLSMSYTKTGNDSSANLAVKGHIPLGSKSDIEFRPLVNVADTEHIPYGAGPPASKDFGSGLASTYGDGPRNSREHLNSGYAA
ncbi:RTA1-domain-containing protein [Atractiella rhizophila]|nr:RTA1-domain-containing protein [Atractiella rhizophila]